ncbi:hypothetical protein RUM43_001064 [Polyplax serrata]|uniref:Uncharacterized protein n=1 Tax=Polyplax serrata TaxID=468196 RepID=A0AAN8SH96_POLSC
MLRTINIVKSRIDFHKLDRPGHLANSEVLKMLEEVEFEEIKEKGFKRVAWPPPPEDVEVVPEITEQAPANSQDPSYTHAKTLPSTLVEVHPEQHRPWDNQIGGGYQSPQPQAPYETFARVPSPQPKLYRPVNFEPPKTTIRLRPTPPIEQEPFPVFESQPAVIMEQGGTRMRGDEKWPPADYKAQAEAENEARKALARGPACRPRRVNKDYTSFFAQHALNASYPSYRAPPGTQHYLEDGTSQF